MASWFNKMTTPYLGYGLVGWLVFAAAGAALLVRRFDVFTAATGNFPDHAVRLSIMT